MYTDTENSTDYLINIKQDKVQHYCNWVFAASKGNEILKILIDLIVERINLPISDLQKTVPDTVHFLTGPSAFTDAINLSKLPFTLFLPCQFGAFMPVYIQNWGDEYVNSFYVYHHFGSLRDGKNFVF